MSDVSYLWKTSLMKIRIRVVIVVAMSEDGESQEDSDGMEEMMERERLLPY